MTMFLNKDPSRWFSRAAPAFFRWPCCQTASPSGGVASPSPSVTICGTSKPCSFPDVLICTLSSQCTDWNGMTFRMLYKESLARWYGVSDVINSCWVEMTGRCEVCTGYGYGNHLRCTPFFHSSCAVPGPPLCPPTLGDISCDPLVLNYGPFGFCGTDEFGGTTCVCCGCVPPAPFGTRFISWTITD